jgi:hypothetical protein
MYNVGCVASALKRDAREEEAMMGVISDKPSRTRLGPSRAVGPGMLETSSAKLSGVNHKTRLRELY